MLMSLPEHLRVQLLETFQAELDDHLANLTKGLLALEGDPPEEERAEILKSLFRAAHSLKGAARAVDVTGIETLSHGLEDTLLAFHQGLKAITPEHIDRLLAWVDAIGEVWAMVQSGRVPPADVIQDTLERLASEPGATIAPEAAPKEAAPSAPAPPPASAPETPAAGAIRPAPAPPASSAPETPASPAAKATFAPLAANEDTLRVSARKLDAMMDNLGELLVVRQQVESLAGQLQELRQLLDGCEKKFRRVRPLYRGLLKKKRLNGPASHPGDPSLAAAYPLANFLAEAENDIKSLSSGLNGLNSRLRRIFTQFQIVSDDLQDNIRRARLVPFTTLADLFQRMVRDLAHSQGKLVELQVQGSELEVDRQVLELLKDPLIHLLRNAVDHGLEPPAQRQTLGKPAGGLVLLRVEGHGDTLWIEVSDDGQGLDAPELRQAAVQRGLLNEREAADLSDEDAHALIFHAGLSTAHQVTGISGRGIGMDVVRKNLEQMRGSIRLESQAGVGTRFFITVPVSLATSQILLARLGAQVVGLPVSNVERSLRVKPAEVGNLEGRPAILVDGRCLPLVNLGQALGFPLDEPPGPGTSLAVVVLRALEKRLAVQVDGLLTTQEAVIKRLGPQLRRVRNISGVTVLGDGQPVVILNAIDLVKTLQASTRSEPLRPAVPVQAARRRVLVVDDSITTRTLEKHILESAGYEVQVAADGQEAWSWLLSEASLPEALISDVNMPVMDGIALTEHIKADLRFQHIPVILVTSLDSPADKLRGLQAGADAYVVKSSFDQHELLETLQHLIG